jgi:hypothetical protein
MKKKNLILFYFKKKKIRINEIESILNQLKSQMKTATEDLNRK